jgi:RNA polymerase-associated protein
VFAAKPFFMSVEFSLVDCCVAPLLWRLPMLGIELPPNANAIQTYSKRIFDWAAFRDSMTEAEREMAIDVR